MSNDIYSRRVKDVMSRDVVAISAADTVHEALALMGENRVSALPVVDSKNHCVGILSTSDLVDMTRDVDDDLYQLDLVDSTSRRFLLDKLAHSMGSETVQSFMSEAVATVSPDTHDRKSGARNVAQSHSPFARGRCSRTVDRNRFGRWTSSANSPTRPPIDGEIGLSPCQWPNPIVFSGNSGRIHR